MYVFYVLMLCLDYLRTNFYNKLIIFIDLLLLLTLHISKVEIWNIGMNIQVSNEYENGD